MPERAEHDKSKVPQLSRLAKLRKEWAKEIEGREEDDYAPDMPPLIGYEYLLKLFWDIGPVMSGAMGAGPLTHGEIESAQRNLRIRLDRWECLTLRRMSIEYLNQSQASEKRDAKAPWQPVDVKLDLSGVAKSMQESILALAQL